MLIESAMPTYDVVIAEHLVVAADPPATFTAAWELDLLTVRTPLLTMSMWLRGLPARWSGGVTPPPPRLVIGEDLALPGWVSLGQRPNREIAFGAVGRFWQPSSNGTMYRQRISVASPNLVGARSPRTFPSWRTASPPRC
jgi:hypothetical protein